MEIQKVCGVYFSGTGTTEKTVRCIALETAKILHLNYEEIDFTPFASRNVPLTFFTQSLVVFGVPVIAGRVPNVLLKYLSTIEGNGALAVPLVLYGNRNYDNALIELRDILEKSGLHTVAGGAFVGEHSFSTVLGAGRPDAADIQIMHGFAEKLAENVRDMVEVPKPVEVKGVPAPYGGYYQPRDRKGNPIDIRKVKPVTDESCVDCKLCARLCPMGSISNEDVHQVTGICMKCCACVKGCPVGAKTFVDAGFLYHKEELEAEYVERKVPELFF